MPRVYAYKGALAGGAGGARSCRPGGAVRRVHTAAMQVLCAFYRSRAEHGRSTELASCSEPLRDAARLLGLGGTLGLASNEPTVDGREKKNPVEKAA